jgi:hypothetical protein
MQNKKLQKILFIWIIPSELFIKPFLSLFENMDKNLVQIDIFITNPNVLKTLGEKYYHIFNIFHIKPDIAEYLEQFFINNKIVNMEEVGIFSCSSLGLTNDVKKLCIKHNIDLYNENFS